MRVDLSHRLTEDRRTAHVLARVSADGADPANPSRKPVNLALVIDRSSSMRGPRISQAARAAVQLIERLDERDRLTVVTFDSSARIVFGPASVTEAARAGLVAAMTRLRTGVGTNLAAGWKKGAEAVASGFVREAVSRVILLTDGQPSVGITSGSRLGQLVEREVARGVTTTAMGVGEGFDDELLSEMARRGRGGFYYLASAAAIPAAFGRELAGVFAIAATGTELRLKPAGQISSAEVLHRLPSRPFEDGLIVELGDIASGAPRHVLFKLHKEGGMLARHCGTLMVTYRDGAGAAHDGHIIGIELPEGHDPARAAMVDLERLRLEVAAAVDEAWARRASGDRAHALAALRAIKTEVAEVCETEAALVDGLNELLHDIHLAETAVAKSGAERERARRGMRERSQLTLLGHSTIRPLPPPEDD